MDKIIKIAMVLTAYDKMTRTVRYASGEAQKEMKKLKEAGRLNIMKGASMMGAGIGIAASMTPAIAAFADLEDSATRLKTAMMYSDGSVAKEFGAVNKLAVQLGNKLPGTTSDFQGMFEVLLNNGIDAKTILAGVGQSAAYLAVGLKMPYEEAAKMAAKLKEATGTSSKDMMAFMDVIAKTKNVGVDPSEMQYAFGRSAGTLKMIKMQGLQASKEMAATYAMLIRNGMSGETVGTGFGTIMNSMLDKKKITAMNEAAGALGVKLDFIDTKGNFLGMDNMMKQLDKLKGFSAGQRAAVVNALTGGGQDASMLQQLIEKGTTGFKEMKKSMDSQASLNQKVQAQLNTLNAIWEATKGTITNALASMGAAIAPALKKLADFVGKMAAWLQGFAEANPRIFQTIGVVTALVSAVMTLGGAFYVVKGAFQILSSVVGGSPIGLIILGIAVLAGILIANWDKVVYCFKWIYYWIVHYIKKVGSFLKDYGKIILGVIFPFYGIYQLFEKFAPKILDIVKKAFKWVYYWVVHYIKIIVKFFKDYGKIILGVIFPIYGVIQLFQKFGPQMLEAGKNIVKSIWEGIKSFAHKPIEAIKNMVQKIRNMLPFSPAKEGPLRDIHRIRLVETIMENVKPAKVVSKMTAVSREIVNTLNQNIGINAKGGSFQNANTAPLQAIGVSRSTSNNSNININYHVSISGSAANKEGGESFVSQLKKYESELIRVIQEANRKSDRRKY